MLRFIKNSLDVKLVQILRENKGQLLHLLCIIFLFISIYITRYAHVYNLRQKMCQQTGIQKNIWITRQGTEQGNYTRVESGEFRLLFSRAQSPMIGEQIQLIGAVRDRSQCDKDAQIDLIVQGYHVVRKIDSSPFYIYRYPLIQLLIFTNRYLQSTEEDLYRYMPSDHVHILLGMTLGRKYSSQEGISVAMKSAGLTHVLVASGANIAILMTFIRAVFRRIISRKNVIYSSVIVACMYTAVVGNQAPILRALCMFLISTAATLIGRKISPLYPLFLGGGIILIFQPFLLFSLSFWLTISATAAIFVESLLNDHANLSSNDNVQSEITSTLSSTMIVFLCTTPILLYSIGNVTLVTLGSSLLLLWMVSPMTILGLLLVLSHAILPNLLFNVFCIIPWIITELFIRFVNLFSIFSFLMISVPSVTILGLILYYVVLFVWVLCRLAAVRRSR